MSNDLSRRVATLRYEFVLRADVVLLRFTLVPDAGVTSGAPPGGASGVFGVLGRKTLLLSFREGMRIRDTPVEYRLRPRELPAIRHDSV